ncbi:MAG: chitobiase/beta-hexosaminidase C-terminal domain-containing protein [Roseburia sp.]
MRHLKKKKRKYNRKKYLYITGIAVFLLVLGSVAYMGAVSAGRSTSLAQSDSYDVMGVTDKLTCDDQVRGTLSLPAPGDGYRITSDDWSVSATVTEDYFCKPGDVITVTDWDPQASYEASQGISVKTWEDPGEILTGYFKGNLENNTAQSTDYRDTFYLILDGEPEAQTLTQAELWNKFMSYLETKGIAIEENQKRIQMVKNQSTKAWDNDPARINELWNDFMGEMGAKRYEADKGIVIPEDGAMNQTILLIRWDIEQTNLTYFIQLSFSESGDWITGPPLSDDTIAAPLISVNYYPVQKKTAIAAPKVTTKDASGQTITCLQSEKYSVFKDASVTLQLPEEAKTVNDTRECEFSYFLSSTDYSEEEVLKQQWKTVAAEDEGLDIALAGKNMAGNTRYLYVQLKIKDSEESYFGESYTDSEIVKYTFVYDKGKPDGTIIFQPKDAEGEEEQKSTGVDVGEFTELVWEPGTDAQAAIFYTTDGSIPKFQYFTGDETVTLGALEEKAAEESGNICFVTDASETSNYLKVNGFWYECSKSVQLFAEGDAIPVGKECRAENRIQVEALAVVSGKEIGDYKRLSLPLVLKKTVQNPGTDVATSEDAPTELVMGAAVNFSCLETGSEIFYTTNGSAPVVSTEKQADGTVITVPGNNSTKKVSDGESVTITEEIASYGSNLTFMVKAVCYEDGYRTMNDSEVVKFIYYIGEQDPVTPVGAIPVTDAANPAILGAGRKIALHCDTPGATIYYTIDGTEPVRYEDGTLAGNTYEYNAAEGITMPTQTDSLFTITAIAYKEGMATSEIARFVYKYPSAISSPYATPGSGTVSENTQVFLKSSSEDAVIYYEIAYDGETPKDPTEASSAFEETNPIVITKETKIKAIAVKDGTKSSVSEFSYTIANKLTVPEPSLRSGSVVARGSTVTLTADSEATIYYTTDGSNPADPANTNVNIGNTVFLDGASGSVVTIRTYAAKTGYSNSEIGNYSYTISYYENAIFADKENGTVVKNGDKITLNTDVTGADIYYTLDGSMPNVLSNKGNVVTINGASGSTVVLKAIAVVPGSSGYAAAATYTYTITDKLKAPQSNVPSGAIFTEEGEVTLTAEKGNIYYTTDGSVPNENSKMYQGAIRITSGTTIKAIAISEDADASDVSTFVYQMAGQVADVEASEESGQLDIDTEVILTCDTNGATIYYTTNGTDPDPDNTSVLNVYTGPITISRPVTLKAIAVKSGMQASNVLTVGYTVKEAVVVEEEETVEEEEKQWDNESGRLQSRRTFEESDTGPSFTDILLKNSAYGVVLASDFEVIPEDVQLNVNKVQADATSENLVKQNLGQKYSVVSCYDITLTRNGEEIQPEGTIEIGLPIPSEYENALIYVVHVSEDGTMEIQETRRSGGMAYAKVSHLSQYSIVAPVTEEEKESRLWIYILIGVGVLAVLGAGIGFIVYRHQRYYDI